MFIAVEVHCWLLGMAGGGGWCKCMKRFPSIHFKQSPFLHAQKQHRPDREAYVEVVDETHVHPVDRVPHVSWRGGRWSPLAHLVLPRKEEPLQLSGLLKGCPRTVGPLVR